VFVEEVWHYGVQGDGKGRAPCAGPGCPICALQSKVTPDTWARIKPSRAFLFNAIVRTDEGDKLVIASVGKTVWSRLVQYITDSDIKNALDLKKGRDFYITRTGKGLQTRYDVLPAASPSKAADSKPEVTDLISMRQEPDVGELRKLASAY